AHIAPAAPEIEAVLARNRAALLKARESRVRPGLDDKVLADWNGLAIAALAGAAAVFDRADWLDLARSAFAFITEALGTKDGQLQHSWRGRAQPRAILDDYAKMARAAMALFEATGDAAYLEQARHWVGIAIERYWDPQGGFFFTAADAELLIARAKNALDQPNPSGNGTLAAVLARLYYLTGEEDYRRRAQATLDAFGGEVMRYAFAHASLLNAAELLAKAVQIVVIGRRGEDDTDALLRAAFGQNLPNRVLTVVAPGTALPPSHPAHGKQQAANRATAYVCEGPVCSLPLSEASALARDLANRR
ncbi:MAG: thioredoxin domain-containing protein, partial [Stellaceae bacterium]